MAPPSTLRSATGCGSLLVFSAIGCCQTPRKQDLYIPPPINHRKVLLVVNLKRSWKVDVIHPCSCGVTSSVLGILLRCSNAMHQL
ncbi:putative DNA-helicase [Sesbania bispinosa]|nr:putative DNA-helicase [Sesbania bispinosa]